VCTLMDNYEAKSMVISKQYSVKDIQGSKQQAMLLGVAFTIMLDLLIKYSDFLTVDSTDHHNSLNFLNITFMVRSDEFC
ncbi:12359_t:CDS:1, partial [Cetraspora pellucida]